MSTVLNVWAMAATLFTWVALCRWLYRLVRARSRRRDDPQTPRHSVLCLRPLDAPAPHEHQALSESEVGEGAQQVIVAADISNPECANRKVGHWLYAINALSPGPDTVVVSLDGDVRATPELIQALAGAVKKGAALAMAYPEPEPGPLRSHAWAQALFCGTHLSFRSQDVMRWGAPSACGKAVALGPQACAHLPALAEVVGEDLELAVRLSAERQRVCWVDVPARVIQSPTLRVSQVTERMVRWMQVLRAHRPGLYPTVPLLMTPCWPLLVLAVGGLASPWWVLALWFSRTTLAAVLSPPRMRGTVLRHWPWAEAVLFVAFLKSLFRNTVSWRGRRFTLGRNGVLRAEPLR